MYFTHPPFLIFYLFKSSIFPSTFLFYFFSCSWSPLLKQVPGEKKESLAKREMALANDSALVLNAFAK